MIIYGTILRGNISSHKIFACVFRKSVLANNHVCILYVCPAIHPVVQPDQALGVVVLFVVVLL